MSLSFNTYDRPCPAVPPPAAHKPSSIDFLLSNGLPNIVYLKRHFLNEGQLEEEQALWLLNTATNVFRQEPNLVRVTSPVTICGDIHGQYYDLVKLFEVGGENTYLFLGDYVDRGNFGIECLLYLYALKITMPQSFWMLRGNHECRHLTEYFTFKRECLHKYSPAVYEACITSFCALPVAALVDDRFFCVHGGISPELVTLDDIEKLDRFQEPGSHGLLCDLLWADPIANYDDDNPELNSQGFLHNTNRGCSWYYTYPAVCAFLQRTGLLGVIRGHEAQDHGYTMHRKTPSKKFPSVITIFSAPNYLDVYRNKGAVIKYANKNITIRQFNSSPHPYWLPNFMDAFTWSLPFVGTKITEMLLAILSICSEEELEETAESPTATRGGPIPPPTAEEDLYARRQQIKNKILAVGRMQRVFTILREEAEAATELEINKAEAGVGAGLGVPTLAKRVHSFDEARRSDALNERLPTLPPTPKRDTPFMFPTPSMRRGGDIDMESLIKRVLEEGEGGNPDNDIVEELADRIARNRLLTGKPGALKRHDTVI